MNMLAYLLLFSDVQTCYNIMMTVFKQVSQNLHTSPIDCHCESKLTSQAGPKAQTNNVL